MLKLMCGLLCVELATSGCTMVHTSEVKDLSKPPNGVRLYQPRLLLLVDVAKAKSTIFIAPNFARAYDVKPITIFAKHDFTVEMDDGVLKKLTANQDTTAFLTFLGGAAQLGTKAAGLPVSQNTIDGTFGLPSGLYEFTEDGKIVLIRAPNP